MVKFNSRGCEPRGGEARSLLSKQGIPPSSAAALSPWSSFPRLLPWPFPLLSFGSKLRMKSIMPLRDKHYMQYILLLWDSQYQFTQYRQYTLPRLSLDAPLRDNSGRIIKLPPSCWSRQSNNPPPHPTAPLTHLPSPSFPHSHPSLPPLPNLSSPSSPPLSRPLITCPPVSTSARCERAGHHARPDPTPDKTPRPSWGG